MNKTGNVFDYIKAIADVRSISLAAENLGISQPALSAQLKKVETELGVVLFDRSKQPIEITEAGKAYLEYADRAVALNKELQQNLADIENLNKGSLSVGGATFFNVAYMPEAVADFAKRFPDVDLRIVDGMVPELVTAAQKGLLDLFITPVADDQDRFTYEELLEEKIYLAVPSSWEINKELAGKAIKAAEFRKLCKLPFVVLHKGQFIGRTMEALFEKYGCRPEQVIVAEQTMTSLALTEAGVGVSLVTGRDLGGADKLRRGALPTGIGYPELFNLYLADPILCSRKLYIAYPKNKYLSKAAREFVKVLKETNR